MSFKIIKQLSLKKAGVGDKQLQDYDSMAKGEKPMKFVNHFNRLRSKLRK